MKFICLFVSNKRQTMLSYHNDWLYSLCFSIQFYWYSYRSDTFPEILLNCTVFFKFWDKGILKIVYFQTCIYRYCYWYYRYWYGYWYWPYTNDTVIPILPFLVQSSVAISQHCLESSLTLKQTSKSQDIWVPYAHQIGMMDVFTVEASNWTGGLGESTVSPGLPICPGLLLSKSLGFKQEEKATLSDSIPETNLTSFINPQLKPMAVKELETRLMPQSIR